MGAMSRASSLLLLPLAAVLVASGCHQLLGFTHVAADAAMADRGGSDHAGEGAGERPPPPPSCEDGQQDGSETDVDCGGLACKRCVEGKLCREDLDCLGQSCLGGRCGPLYPAPAQDPRARIGVAHEAGELPPTAGAAGALAWGAGQLKTLGTHTIRLYLGTNSAVYGTASFKSLLEVAKASSYAAVLGEPIFTTILLDVHTSCDDQQCWKDGLSAAERQQELDEISGLASHLVATYPGKRFILMQSGGDGQLTPVTAVALTAYAQQLAARARAVADTRDRTRGLVFSGVELDAPELGAIASGVLPALNELPDELHAVPDYFSLDVRTLLAGTTPGVLEVTLKPALTLLEGVAQKVDPTADGRRLLLGAIGFPREQGGECVAAKRTAAVLDVLLASGLAFGVVHQLLDEPVIHLQAGYGLIRWDGTPGQARAVLQATYTGSTPTLPVVCPVLTGVTTATGESAVHAGDAIAIYGSGLSSTSSDVIFKQGAARYSVSPTLQAATQLNAIVPGLAAEQALISVRSGGSDSNTLTVTILP